MTIVVTTATTYGITVVGDRALSSVTPTGSVLVRSIKKVYYSAAANISFAMWGSATVPSGDMASWMQSFVSSVTAGDSLSSVGNALASELNKAARDMGMDPADLKRGVHVAGYVDGLPHIYHVHTGDRNTGVHPPKLLKDYPFVHTAGVEEYKTALESGKRAQLRNGMPTLFGVVANGLDELREQLANEAGVKIPAPTIFGQLALDRALVRFAASLLEVADRPPTVSVEVDCLAFTQAGLVTDSCNHKQDVAKSEPVLKAHPTKSLA